MKTRLLISVIAFAWLYPVKITIAQSTSLSDTTRVLRLRLYLDPQDYDDIVIGFNDTASTAYNYNYDAVYLAGIGAAEGLASYSSDGVALSINTMPFPGKSQEVIRLKVQAANSGTFVFQRTELDTLPPLYELWLMDTYKKDSLNLRTSSAYTFTINKADTASFGSNRFQVVMRQEPAPGLRLLNFNAIKAKTGAEISWTTENEANYTTFAVERSSDDGKTFTVLDQIISSALGSYSFTDKTPPSATDRYRLQLTDLNGAVSGNISVYPNPARSTLNLMITQYDPDLPSYGIQIINMTGRVVRATSTSQATWQAGIDTLTPGTYVIQVINSKDSSLVGRSTFIKL
jgi:hypothetical protein